MPTPDPIAAALQKTIENRSLAGVSTLVWQRGAVLHRGSVGWRDAEKQVPLGPDSIFRVASMTKPITTVAALMMMEEGRFSLEDPIARFAPEFSAMRVLRTPTSALDDCVVAHRPITFDDLLTHRAGITYGAFHNGPLARAFSDALGGDIDSHVAPDDWIAALAALPLVDQPGAALHYGHATDLLGLLLARIEGASLGDVLKRRVFDPLGMGDTAFRVPRDKAERRARLYGFDDGGRLTARSTAPGASTVAERPADMAYESGGQGLWSTLDDYLAFARLFVGGGAVDGVRLLRPETLQRMMANQLTPEQRARSEVGGMRLFKEGHGYGFGVAVVMEPRKATTTVCGGNVGAVGWPGAFGGWWQVDPSNESVMLFLTHNMIEREQFNRGIGFGVYEAITTFQGLASALVQ